MIISAVVVKVFYYKPLQNLKEYKRFHRRLINDTTFMYRELVTSNDHIFLFTILCINFSILDRPLEHSTLEKCYLCKNLMKGKKIFLNITTAGIDTIKICTEKWKTHKEVSYKIFHLVQDKVKNVSCESLKRSKLTFHSQLWRDFKNYVKISRYNQLETVLGDNTFSDTFIGTTAADELNCFCRMIDRRRTLSFISSRNHCQKFSPSHLSDMP